MVQRREHFEQVSLIDWCIAHEEQAPELKMLFAVPNGGHRSKKVAGEMKAEGMKAGVPDLMLLIAIGNWHGLIIEMKAEGGRVRPNQKWWLESLAREHFRVEVCWSFEEARSVLLDYLGYELYSDEFNAELLRRI
jgi:hypothetical protein